MYQPWPHHCSKDYWILCEKDKHPVSDIQATKDFQTSIKQFPHEILYVVSKMVRKQKVTEQWEGYGLAMSPCIRMCITSIYRLNIVLGCYCKKDGAFDDITARPSGFGGLSVWTWRQKSSAVSHMEHTAVWWVTSAQANDWCHHSHDHCNILCFSVASSDILCEAFQQEVKLKQVVLQEVAHSTNSDLCTVYLSCWLHQPFIPAHVRQTLEALLLETGHRPLWCDHMYQQWDWQHIDWTWLLIQHTV